jgi:diguanylate cyclase (GGDEF)-like protein/PAS domain S-box-containing protein
MCDGHVILEKGEVMAKDGMLLFLEKLTENDRLVEGFREIGLFAMDNESGWSQRSTVMERLGCDHLQLGTEAFEALMHSKDRERCRLLWLMTQRGDTDEFSAVYRIVNAQGEWHWVKSRGFVLRRTSEGGIALFVGIDEDITADKEAEEDLRSQIVESDQRFGLTEALRAAGLAATASLDIAATIANVLQQAQLYIPFRRAAVYAHSAGGLDLIGIYPRDEAAISLPAHGPTSPIWEVMSTKSPHLVDELAFAAQLSQHERLEEFHSWIGIPLIHRGELLGVLELWNADAGEFRSEHLWPAMAFGDILAVELSAEGKYHDLVIEASTDPLSGLLTRRSFTRLGSKLLARLAELGQPIALILADIDHFKSFNDRFGHLKGDDVLREVAEVLKKGVRQEDILCRFGGEEMIALLPNTAETVALDVAERLRANLERHLFAGIEETVTASFGVATCRARDCGSLDDLIGAADRAMYRAKEEGRNRVVRSE